MVARNCQVNAPKAEADSKDCEQVEAGVHIHVNAPVAILGRRRFQEFRPPYQSASKA